ncbi:hypothetical protein QQS21_000596 [Conoideocrella luteorostrata]|uniref:Uncharacterized protein n=1 Tax=Conoideocrella luteorostrata TaxID=1105319 RepID=A0AAJ0G3Z7_9HYPO|nr:hypothetical protein QQS21_000596 [Conoideocrella luteorostrata]
MNSSFRLFHETTKLRVTFHMSSRSDLDTVTLRSKSDLLDHNLMASYYDGTLQQRQGILRIPRYIGDLLAAKTYDRTQLDMKHYRGMYITKECIQVVSSKCILQYSTLKQRKSILSRIQPGQHIKRQGNHRCLVANIHMHQDRKPVLPLGKQAFTKQLSKHTLVACSGFFGVVSKGPTNHQSGRLFKNTLGNQVGKRRLYLLHVFRITHVGFEEHNATMPAGLDGLDSVQSRHDRQAAAKEFALRLFRSQVFLCWCRSDLLGLGRGGIAENAGILGA